MDSFDFALQASVTSGLKDKVRGLPVASFILHCCEKRKEKQLFSSRNTDSCFQKYILEAQHDQNRRLWYLKDTDGHNRPGFNIHGNTLLHEPRGSQARRIQFKIRCLVGNHMQKLFE